MTDTIKIDGPDKWGWSTYSSPIGLIRTNGISYIVINSVTKRERKARHWIMLAQKLINQAVTTPATTP